VSLRFEFGCLAVALLSLTVSSESYGKKHARNSNVDGDSDASSASGIAMVGAVTSTEKQAAQYSREALGRDFRAERYLLAEGKLLEALHLCTGDACSVPFKARLHRDLGFLYAAGLDRPSDARDEFATATSMDPTVALTPAMQTPEVEQAFNDAVTKGGKQRKRKAEPEPSKPEPSVVDLDAETASEEPAVVAAPPEPDGGSHSGLIPNWLTLSIQQDWVYHSKTANACSPSSAYHCYDSSKIYRELSPGQFGGNEISSGGAIAGTMRILLGFDRVVHPHLSLGVRVGSVVSGKALVLPTDNAVLSYHGEARVAVWFGPDVFSRAGVRPYLFLSGGFAESDGRIVVDFKVPGDANTYKLDAWKRSGHTFVSPGFGIQAAVTKSTGPMAEIRYMQYFSPNVPVIAAQLGWAVGF